LLQSQEYVVTPQLHLDTFPKIYQDKCFSDRKTNKTEDEEMASFSYVCSFCSQTFFNYQLRKLDKDIVNFINSFIHNSDSIFLPFLMICKTCSDKVRDFKQFIEKSKNSLSNLALTCYELDVWEPQPKQEKRNKENFIEIVLHESENTNEQINLPQKVENTFTITEVKIDPAQKRIIKHCKDEENSSNKTIPSISIETNREYDILHRKLYDQVAPLDLRKYQVSRETSPRSVAAKHQGCAEEGKILHTQERKKIKNREASRRYRERARRDPELLLRIREQQKKRQKKYYDKIRKNDKKIKEKI